MKKMLATLIALTMLLPAASGLADAPAATTAPASSLAAYWALFSGTQVSDTTAEFELLTRVMNGEFSNANLDDDANRTLLASALPTLSQLPQSEVASFAAAYGMSENAVRHAHYRALANALKAEIRQNPASEERYRNIQLLLDLFLTDDDASRSVESEQEAIRSLMTKEQVRMIATEANLPARFVAQLVMDDDLYDDDWDDDDDWYGDRYDDDWDDDWDDDDGDDRDDDNDDDRYERDDDDDDRYERDDDDDRYERDDDDDDDDDGDDDDD